MSRASQKLQQQSIPCAYALVVSENEAGCFPPPPHVALFSGSRYGGGGRKIDWTKRFFSGRLRARSIHVRLQEAVGTGVTVFRACLERPGIDSIVPLKTQAGNTTGRKADLCSSGL